MHLGAFVDAAEDWQHVEVLRERVANLCVRPLSRRAATLRSLTGFISGKPLTLPYYHDAPLKRWVQQLVSGGELSGALVYSSGMAQYLQGVSLPKVMDFCDLDSDKWARVAKSKAWPWCAVYAREARTLANVERRVAPQDFDTSLFVLGAGV